MRLKLDENLGKRGAELFHKAGHDVDTVSAQGLCSAPDRKVIEICNEEGRCLVTLDLDFGNPLLFKPADYPGIAVLRLPPKPTSDDLFDAIGTLIRRLGETGIHGKLWIVQRGSVREYEPEEEPDR